MLVPVQAQAPSNEANEGATTVAGTEPKGQQPDFVKNIANAPGVRDLMRDETQEQPDQPFPEWGKTDAELDAELEAAGTNPVVEQPKPEETKPEATPTGTEAEKAPQTGKIVAAGQEFKSPEELARDYEALHKGFHQKNYEHKQEVLQLEIAMQKMADERAHLEKLLQGNIVKMANAGKVAEPTAKSTEPLSKDEFERLVQEENGYDAVNKLINARLNSIAAETQQAMEQVKAKAPEVKGPDEVVVRKNIAIAESDPDISSFKENKVQFGTWLADKMGFDKSQVDNLCANYTRMKDTYRTYLKDTYDFSAERQRLLAEGQSIAETKKALNPIDSKGSTATVSEQPQVSKLTPTNMREQPSDPLDAMEFAMGVGQNRRGIFEKSMFR